MDHLYRKLLQRVLKELGHVCDNSRFHLASVAKAIEQALGSQLKITFREVSSECLGKLGPAVLINQELQVELISGTKQMKLMEHIICYSEQSESLATRFYVAHELGHIALHQNCIRDDNHRCELPNCIPDIGKHLYCIEFSDEEEMEADLFASILVEQRPYPDNLKVFQVPCLRSVQSFASSDNGLCFSKLHEAVSHLPRTCESCDGITRCQL